MIVINKNRIWNKTTNSKTQKGFIGFINKTMQLSILMISMVCLTINPEKTSGQINIISANIQPFNITPQSLCAVTVMNPVNNLQVALEAKILNNSGEPLLIVRTGPFQLTNGITNISSIPFTIISADYGTTMILIIVTQLDV